MNLDDPVSVLPNVGPVYVKKLEKLNIKSLHDLLTHVPVRFSNYGEKRSVTSVGPGETVSITGEIDHLKNIRTKSGKLMQIGSVHDESGSITVVWFNQTFLTKALFPGRQVNLAGKVGFFSRKVALISPQYEIIYKENQSTHTQGFVAVYPETAGVSSKWLRARVKYLLSKIKLNEYFPDNIRKKNRLIELNQAFEFSHFPKDENEYKKGLKRLSFDELLFLHLESLERKSKWINTKPSYQLEVKPEEVGEFINKLPFSLTKSQKNSIEEILMDLGKPTPMNRILEGDVGSGKTVVAAVSAFVSFLNGYQTLIMAPTQILAVQHYNSLKKWFDPYKIRMALLTSTTKSADVGRADVFIGTHSLIEKSTNFDKVALTVIDEQHRFGVKQREKLVKKGSATGNITHTLTMTATPIPRTVALTLYGDLDLSVLTEMPKGRQKITTWVVPPQKRNSAYKWIAKQITKDKVQVFIICPLIEESDFESMVNVKSVKLEYQKLRKIFRSFKLGLLHGRLKPKEKDEALEKFKTGETDILVSTPVVEVGIDIPNATIMLIETAERFGLAALHQLRGRVGRGSKKSYCLLFTENKSKQVSQRLSALTKLHSGFELAELDLKLRGPGEIFGNRQHGLPELRIASWSDTSLIKASKEVAINLYNNPKKYKNLLKELQDRLHVN